MNAEAWWSAHRWRYNVSLCVAGLLAFVAYAVVISSPICESNIDAEITIFTTIFQGAGFIVALCLANACYSVAGAIVRRIASADRAYAISRMVYTAGLIFSLVLIVTIPALAYFECRMHA